MTFLEFVVAWWTASIDLVRALAWPTVVVVSILLLRKPLSQLIPALQSLKVAGAEVAFYERLGQAERAADATKVPEPSDMRVEVNATSPGQTLEARAEVNKEPEQPTSKTDVGVIAESLRKTARTIPAQAIASAMSWMNEELRRALKNENLHSEISIGRLASELRAKGLITNETVNQVSSLVAARNMLNHSPADFLTVEAAIRFVDTTEQTVIAIREGL